MSSIIETVSFKPEDQKSLNEKFLEHLGINQLEVNLDNGGQIVGVLSEVGRDFLLIIEHDKEVLIPSERISFVRYGR